MLSEGIDKAGGISANSFLNTVEKLECRIANLEESNNALSIKIFSSLDISNPVWKTDARLKDHVNRQASAAEEACSAMWKSPLLPLLVNRSGS